MTDVKWEVIPGQILVSPDGVWQVIDQENVKIWEIDLRSKYVEVFYGGTYADDDVTYEVFMMAGENTLKYDEDTELPTAFKVSGLEDGWHIFADSARYTVRVVMFKYPKREGIDE